MDGYFWKYYPVNFAIFGNFEICDNCLTFLRLGHFSDLTPKKQELSF